MLSSQVQCPICAGWFSKYGIRNHERIVHEGTQSVAHFGGRKKPWNKGLTQQTDGRITGHSAQTRELCRQKSLGRVQSASTRQKLRHHAVAAALGGHTSKRRLNYLTKTGHVVNLRSSYEVQVAVALDTAAIAWVRPSPLPWTDAAGILHRYYPDFYLPAFDVYLDPKNDFLQRRDAVKIEAVRQQRGVKILVLGREELNWAAIFAKIPPP